MSFSENRKEVGGLKAYTLFRNAYDNNRLSELMLNRNVLAKITQKGKYLIRNFEPIYMLLLRKQVV